MKPSNNLVLTSVFALSPLLGACSQQKEDNDAQSANEAVSESFAETKEALSKDVKVLKEEGSAYTDTIKSWSYAQRAEAAQYYEKLNQQFDAQLVDIKETSARLSASAQKQWQAGLAEVTHAKAKLSQTLARMKDASADNWDAAKADMASAWSEMEAGIAKMKAAASEKGKE